MGNRGDARLKGRGVDKIGWYAAAILLAASTVACHTNTPTSDRTREGDVLEIIWGLRNVNGIYGEIPAAYLDLAKRGFGAPVDPVVRKPYEYTHTGTIVTVCANFDKASPGWNGLSNAAAYGDPVVHGFGSWTHGPGRQCLTKDISPGKH
jgi:hypothetical protein